MWKKLNFSLFIYLLFIFGIVSKKKILFFFIDEQRLWKIYEYMQPQTIKWRMHFEKPSSWLHVLF